MKRVFPVIHLVNQMQCLEQAQISFSLGAAGVFLIDMGGSRVSTEEAYGIIREEFMDEYIGINILGMRREAALAEAQRLGANGLWLDNAGIDERPETWDLRGFKGGAVEIFGGVAFKYQRAIADEKLEMVTTQAARILDVVCTSGPGTGQAADVAKLATMRAAIDEEREQTGTRLAVASGVSPENAEIQLEIVDDVLLATGIEESFGYLSAPRLEEVVKIAESLS